MNELFDNDFAMHSRNKVEIPSRPARRSVSKWLGGGLALTLTLAAVACGSGPSPEATKETSSETSSDGLKAARGAEYASLVAQAQKDSELTGAIDALGQEGWTGESIARAGVSPNSQGELTLVLSFSKAAEHASIDLVYTASGAEGQGRIVVRPADKESETVFMEGSKAPASAQDVGTMATCDPGCNRGTDCEQWSCQYIESQGNFISCVNGDDNPFGNGFIHRRRAGVTNRAFCAGIYADYRGRGIACPLPNKTLSWLICSKP